MTRGPIGELALEPSELPTRPCSPLASVREKPGSELVPGGDCSLRQVARVLEELQREFGYLRVYQGWRRDGEGFYAYAQLTDAQGEPENICVFARCDEHAQAQLLDCVRQRLAARRAARNRAARPMVTLERAWCAWAAAALVWVCWTVCRAVLS